MCGMSLGSVRTMSASADSIPVGRTRVSRSLSRRSGGIGTVTHPVQTQQSLEHDRTWFRSLVKGGHTIRRALWITFLFPLIRLLAHRQTPASSWVARRPFLFVYNILYFLLNFLRLEVVEVRHSY